MVKAKMTVRHFNLVLPLAHKATAMRTMETADSHQNASSAVTLPIDKNLEQGDVDSKIQRSTPLTRTMPGTRTSTMATRITTTRATKCVPALSADYSERGHADFLKTAAI
jgi:RNA-directed DNA polymerase